ncbi:long-chain-fatty-acid--CoA ligase [Metabacillus malikii]|nr:long-chain-fatty-acid--CoA ligase [Metabacillus malikii]
MDLSSQFSQVVKNYGDKTAFIIEQEHITYNQLEQKINQFASGLIALGLEKGDHVGLILGNSPHFIISFYGAIRAGMKIIPINPVFTPNELVYLLNNGDVKCVITNDLLIPTFERIDYQLQQLEKIIVCETSQGRRPYADRKAFIIYDKMKTFSDLLSKGTPNYIGPNLDEDDIASILYTSGTTSKQKGVMLTHKNLLCNAASTSQSLRMTNDDIVVTALPMFHNFCLTVALNAPLLSGATVVILPRFSPSEIFQLVNTYQATIFVGIPTMYNHLLQFKDSNNKDFKSLRLCISGGASMPIALLREFEKNFNAMISEGYGLAEATAVTCFNRLDQQRKHGSIGQCTSNVEIKIVNEFCEEVLPNHIGELIVKGPNVMKGYYNFPEETKRTIRNGWLYTGDLAKKDEDGYFFIVGRKKESITIAGVKVYPREIEEILYSHKDVLEAIVIGIPDLAYGEKIHCFVVVKNKKLTEEMLRNYCKGLLANYKLPSAIHFLKELPKNKAGKVLTNRLKEQIL